MLGNYLKFNNETFPNPTSPSMASKTLENVSQSEAGTDLVCIVRPSNKSWTVKFTLTSGKAETRTDGLYEVSVKVTEF